MFKLFTHALCAAIGVTFCVHVADTASAGDTSATLKLPGLKGIAVDPDEGVLPGRRLRAEGRLTGGRIAQLPVSWYYETTISSSSGLHVRTVCRGDENDTGLIVRGRGLVRFSDNSSLAGGNRQGSYVRFEPPPRSGREPYTITVFSMRRGTAHCSVDYSRDGGITWVTLRADSFGGTLIDVGPLRSGDTIESQARARGEGGDNTARRTQLLLFSPTDETRPAITALTGGLDGGNPRITITGGGWRGGRNFVLVGKQTRSSVSNGDVETRVDLLHGPLNADQRQAALGTWRRLDVGRYYGLVYAKTSAPVGHTAGFRNPSNAMPTTWTCPSTNRGRLDGRAFQMNVERQSGTTATSVTTRRVRLAQLGAKENEYNAFLLTFEVGEPGNYRMTVIADDPTVVFFSDWRTYRNPDASELTVVSYNTLYDDGHNHHNKTLNASNLLATRGHVWRTSLSVEAMQDQAPFQWEADVIGLQELRRGAGSNFERWREYVDLFRDEAERMGSRGWSYVWGRDEKFTFGTDGLAPIFVASPFYPGSASGSIDFPDSALDEAGCDTSSIDPTWVQCELNEEGPSPGRAFYAVLGRISVRRFDASSDRPIVVVNVHLRSGEKFQDRLDQLNDLMGMLDTLLREAPTAFNRSGSTNPQHHQNRIIVLGDLNMSSHHCGEHYWLLRRFREHFGYALDAAMATGDYDMHDESGSFVNWIDSSDWKRDPAANPDFPWWLTTYRGGKADGSSRTERYDAIMLVGKGWAYDDPVVDYQVMNDRSGTTPMAPDGFAVEQWHASDLVQNGLASGIAFGYRPNYRLSLPPGVGSNRPFVPGEPALDSDHAPIRARLRVFQR